MLHDIYVASKGLHDIAQHGNQNMSTTHLHITHGIDGSFKLTWEHHVTVTDSKNSKV